MMTAPYVFGTLLFDLQNDPQQEHPMIDDRLELRMINLMLELMRGHEAPEEQFERLGLPVAGPATEAHLQIEQQWPQVISSRQAAPRRSDFPQGRLSVHTPLRDLLAEPAAKIIVERYLPDAEGVLSRVAANRSPLEVAAFAIGLLPLDRLRELSDELIAAS